MPSNFGLPPVVAWRGANPSHAARSRPRGNARASPTAATRAVAVRAPTAPAARRGGWAAPAPGTVPRRAAALSAGAPTSTPPSNPPSPPAPPPPLRTHVLDQPPQPRPKTAVFVRQDLRQQPLELAPSLRA